MRQKERVKKIMEMLIRIWEATCSLQYEKPYELLMRPAFRPMYR